MATDATMVVICSVAPRPTNDKPAPRPFQRYKARIEGSVFAKPEFADLWKAKPDARHNAGATAAAALRRPAPFGSATRLKILKILLERPPLHEDGAGCGFNLHSMRAKGCVGLSGWFELTRVALVQADSTLSLDRVSLWRALVPTRARAARDGCRSVFPLSRGRPILTRQPHHLI